MTIPFREETGATVRPFDPSVDGLASPASQQEWQTFLDMRREAMNEGLARQAVVSSASSTIDDWMGQLNHDPTSWLDPYVTESNKAQVGALDPLSGVPQGLQPRAYQGMMGLLFPNATTDPNASEDRDKLLDVAKAWDIPGASEMPQEQLQAAIAAKRADAVRPTDIGVAGWIRGLAGSAGRGAQEALGEATKDIPYIGESMNRLIHSDAATKWTNMMAAAGNYVGGGTGLSDVMGLFQTDPAAMRTQQEQAEAGMPASEVSAAHIVNKIGYGIGYVAPSIAAWNAVGALGGIKYVAGVGKLMSPISRAAIQGATSTWLMTGGAKEDPNALLGQTILGGAFAGTGAILNDMWAGRKAAQAAAEAAFPSSASEVPPQSAEERWAAEDAERQGVNMLGGNTRTSASVVGVRNPSDPFYPDFEVHDEPSPVRSNTAGPAGGGDLTGADGGTTIPPNPNAIVRYGSNVGDGVAFPNAPPSAPSAAPSPVRAITGSTSPVDDILDYPHAPYRPIVPVAPQARFLAGTHVADAYGNALRVYHGTNTDFDNHDPTKSDPTALWGDGIYYTEDPKIAGGTGDLASSTGYAVGGDSPQVRAAFLDIKKPFRLDQLIYESEHGASFQYEEDAGHAFIDKFAAANPGVDVDQAHQSYDSISTSGDTQGINLSNEHLHIALQQATTPPVEPGDGGLYGPTPLGRNGVNDGLKAMGYDGLTHIGGWNTDNEPHRVWIPWDPTQVHPAWTAPYTQASDGIALTKQHMIQESPLAAELANKPSLSHADVARAAVASNSGGISVISDIGNLGQTVQDMALAAGRGSPLNYRFGLHPSGRVDLLVSDADIPDKALVEYQQHGMFTGQSVITASGRAGYVSKLTDDKVTVKNPYTGSRAVTLRKSSVFPRSGSEAYVEAPEAWDAFKDYASKYIAQESGKAGLTPPGIFDPQYTQMLPDVLNSWLDKSGIVGAPRQALQSYFGVRRVEEYKALAPQEYAMMDEAGRQADVAEEEADVARPPTLTQKAETKGFFWAQSPQFPGGQLWDRNSSLKMAFATDDEAEAFLQNLDREAPDHTVGGDVPGELADMRYDSQIPPSGTVEDAIDALDHMGGAPHIFGSLPPEPPDLPPGFEGLGEIPYNEPPRIGPKPSYFEEFQRVPTPILADLDTKYNGVLTQMWRSVPSTFQNMETDFGQIGVSAKPWSRYEAVEAGMKQMESESYPWQVRANSVLSRARQLILRNGEFTRIHEVEDPNTREHMMTNAGWTPGDREASRMLKDLTDDLYDYGQSRGIFREGERGFIERYLSHVAMREGMPGVENPWKDYDGYLPKDFKFFADNLRQGGMSARQMDPRWLMQKYIRAMHWGLHVAQPMQEFLNETQQTGLPSVMEQYAGNWAKAAQYGYTVDKDMAVRGLQGIINFLGEIGHATGPLHYIPGSPIPKGGTPLKITTQQAAMLLNRGLTNMHWAFLGFTPKVLFQHAVQPIWAMIKADIPTGLAAYRDFFVPKLRDEMLQRSLDGGWADVGRAPVEMPSSFGVAPMMMGGQGLTSPSGEMLAIPQNNAILTEAEQYTQEMFAGLGDKVRDMVPRWMRNIQGGVIDPLGPLRKLWNFNRVIAGEIGYRSAARAGDRLHASNMVSAGLATDDQKELVRDMTHDGIFTPMSKEQYLSESALDGFMPPIGEAAWNKVSEGDYTGAAHLAGRAMANETMYQYGVRNLAPKARSTTGRMLMAFGTFANQSGTMVGNGLRRGSQARRAKFLLGLATTGLGLKKLSDETGFNFMPWWLVGSFSWAGSPMVSGLATALPAWSAFLKAATEDDATPREEGEGSAALDDLAKIPFQFLKSQNPIAGLVHTGEALHDAFQAPNPAYEAAGVLMTGPSAAGAEYRQMFRQMNQDVNSTSPIPDFLRQHIDSIPGGGARQ